MILCGVYHFKTDPNNPIMEFSNCLHFELPFVAFYSYMLLTVVAKCLPAIFILWSLLSISTHALIYVLYITGGWIGGER